MDIVTIRNTVDSFYQDNEIEKGYQYLLEQLQLAMEQQVDDIVLGILNEILGYLRVTGKFELGKNIAGKMDILVSSLQLQNTIVGATTYLNMATFYSIAKELDLAKKYYQYTKDIYAILLTDSDERVASLYNNMSIFYQQNNHFTNAYKYQKKAIAIISTLPNCQIETATSYTNLANICFSLHQIDKGWQAITKSLFLFKDSTLDVHYPSALATKAHGYFLIKEYQKAITTYKEALSLLEQFYGKTSNYQIVKQNMLHVLQVFDNYKKQGMYLCLQYYIEVAKPILEKEFPDHFNTMAIGLVGFGSECFGFDDNISRDHDFGPGFCIWLPRNVYQEIGKQVQLVYDALPKEYQGYTRNTTVQGAHRVGVFCLEDFYYSFIKEMPITPIEWLSIPQVNLATITNGQVFHDPLGVFTNYRNTLLAYYPEDVRIKKIVTCLAKIAQSGQYNYARCMQRKQYVASSLAINEFVEHTIACIYLLNRQYMPFYKWAHHGIKNMLILSDVYQDLETLSLLPFQIDCWNKDTCRNTINIADKKVQLIESICSKIVVALKQQELTDSDDSFLENHTSIVMQKIKDKEIASMHIMEG